MSNSTKNKIKQKVKSHIPKDWLCELRIAYRIGLETVNGLRRTGLANIAIITTMAAILTIFGALFRTTLSLSTFAKELGNVLEISVYLKYNAQPNEVAKVIRELPNVERVKVITKEEAWKDFKKEIDVNDIDNPLPDTLHVKINEPKNINAAYDSIKKMRSVESLSFADDIAKKLQLLNNAMHSLTVVVMIILGMLTITIINNTIHLVIESRKDEIEVMRLMGVSNWYIKIPLILQGAIYGFLGGLIALFPLNMVQSSLLKAHAFLVVAPPVFANETVLITMFLLAIGFGAGGSFLSIKKHLQV